MFVQRKAQSSLTRYVELQRDCLDTGLLSIVCLCQGVPGRAHKVEPEQDRAWRGRAALSDDDSDGGVAAHETVARHRRSSKVCPSTVLPAHACNPAGRLRRPRPCREAQHCTVIYRRAAWHLIMSTRKLTRGPGHKRLCAVFNHARACIGACQMLCAVCQARSTTGLHLNYGASTDTATCTRCAGSTWRRDGQAHGWRR